eukprot:10718669-Heterocapsa_arctica.AAC.1
MIGVPSGLFVAKGKAFSSLYPKGVKVLQNKRAKSGASRHPVNGNFVGLQPVSLMFIVSSLQSTSLVSCGDCVYSDRVAGGYPASPRKVNQRDGSPETNGLHHTKDSGPRTIVCQYVISLPYFTYHVLTHGVHGDKTRTVHAAEASCCYLLMNVILVWCIVVVAFVVAVVGVGRCVAWSSFLVHVIRAGHTGVIVAVGLIFVVVVVNVDGVVVIVVS